MGKKRLQCFYKIDSIKETQRIKSSINMNLGKNNLIENVTYFVFLLSFHHMWVGISRSMNHRAPLL